MMNQDEQWLLKEKYHDKITNEFKADCERLQAGEPLAYLIGSIPFLSTTIHLDSHPLIPRPETEFWTEKAIKQIRGAALKEPKILDLCAGSGAIGVAVLKEVPEAQVTFAEIDPTHFPTIEKNIKENISNPVPPTYSVVQSDLFQNITGSFDYILTNPPYIDEEADTVDQSVVSFEPHRALFGGEKGILFIIEIITKARGYLTNTGELWIEHEPTQVDPIKKLAREAGFLCTVHTDQYGVARYSVLSVAQ